MLALLHHQRRVRVRRVQTILLGVTCSSAERSCSVLHVAALRAEVGTKTRNRAQGITISLAVPSVGYLQRFYDIKSLFAISLYLNSEG